MTTLQLEGLALLYLTYTRQIISFVIISSYNASYICALLSCLVVSARSIKQKTDLAVSILRPTLNIGASPLGKAAHYLITDFSLY